MKRDNKIVVDLSKVQHARFAYRNQYGHFCYYRPAFSVRGISFDPHAKAFVVGCDGEVPKSMLEYATKRGLLDRWQPVVQLKLTANESLEYSGDRAISIYKEWCSRIFKHKK